MNVSVITQACYSKQSHCVKITSVHHSHFSISHLLHNTNDSVCCGQNVYTCSLHQYMSPVTYHSVLQYLHVDKALNCHSRYMLYVLNSPQLWLPLFYVLYLNCSWGGRASCDLSLCIDVRQMCKYNEDTVTSNRQS